MKVTVRNIHKSSSQNYFKYKEKKRQEWLKLVSVLNDQMNK